MAVVIVAALGGSFLLIQRGAARAADESIDQALSSTQTAVHDALTSRSDGLRRVTAGLAQVPTYVSRVVQAFAEDDRAALLDQVEEFKQQTGSSWTMIVDRFGVLQAWTYDLNYFGEDMTGGSLIDFALAGDSTQGYWIELDDRGGDVLFQAVGIPIYDPERTTVHGALVNALIVDEIFVSELKTYTGSDVAFFSIDSLGRADVRVGTVPIDEVTTAMGPWDVASAFESNVQTERLELETDRGTLVGALGALTTAAGSPLGGYVGLRSRGAALAAYTRFERTVLWTSLGALLLAVAASYLVSRHITRPVKRLVEMTRRVRDGQYTGDLNVRSADEIGHLADAFQEMMSELKAKDELVHYLQSSSSRTVAMDPEKTEPQGLPVVKVPTNLRSRMLSPGGTLAGRYEILELLGAGGMGVVYRARDRELGEIVAIKTLLPEALEADPSVIDRFKQEIRLARRITHRNVVRTHDLGEEDGMYYITMEYVEGTTLKDLIDKRGALPVNVTLTVGKQLCRALQVAHEEGVVHRDIKPQNIVVEPNGFLKVMDFGIARLAKGNEDSGQQLTAVGSSIGTPDYMAPEQIMGEAVDARTDIYAAGVVLYECMTGKPVFSAPTVHALVVKHIDEEPVDPRNLNALIPQKLSQIVLIALAKKPAQRWQSSEAFYNALDGVKIKVAA